MKKLQISSGRGPVECELAVGKYLEVFLKDHPKAKILEKSLTNSACSGGLGANCYKSVLLELAASENAEVGIVKWVCKSPFRKNHKRKNWFIEIVEVKADQLAEEVSYTALDLKNPGKKTIRFETFRSPGKGGQNVNKVETGARVIHLPTGIAVSSTTARTQLQNKKLALERLMMILLEHEKQRENILAEARWLEHEKLVRGNAFAVYSGPEFARIK